MYTNRVSVELCYHALGEVVVEGHLYVADDGVQHVDSREAGQLTGR